MVVWALQSHRATVYCGQWRQHGYVEVRVWFVARRSGSPAIEGPRGEGWRGTGGGRWDCGGTVGATGGGRGWRGWGRACWVDLNVGVQLEIESPVPLPLAP
jgi:hypothetical protein